MASLFYLFMFLELMFHHIVWQAASCQGTQINSVSIIKSKQLPQVPVIHSSTKCSCTNDTGTLEEVTSEPKITV